jgi:hypothetical protein
MQYDLPSYRAGAEAMREAAAKWHEATADQFRPFATRDASGAWSNGPALSEDAHRRYAATFRRLPLPDAPAEPAPQPDADGWISWGGGECPVAPKARVNIRFRTGVEDNDRIKACTVYWRHELGDADIVAYRPAQPAEPSAPVAEDEADDAYKIGLREGREGAIQDLDLKTGGDGEYRGSTTAGRTVGEAAMEQRIVNRYAALEAEVAALREGLKPFVQAVEMLSLGDGEDDHLSWRIILKVGDLRRARALLQEGRGNG